MAELLSEDTLIHVNPSRLITTEWNVEGSEGEVGSTPVAGGVSMRLQSSTAVLELGKKLLHAAREGDTAAVLALMSKGAPFTTDWLGTSPLHLAAMNAHSETCRVLLRAGISRDIRTKVERTPLHLAAYEGHSQVCSLLLEHGAHHDSRDMLQMTPLHWAVERGHGECVRVLLEAGADPHATSKFLKTPLSLASASGDRYIINLLHEALLNNIHKESEASAHAIQDGAQPEDHMEVDVNPLLVKAEEMDSGGGGRGTGEQTATETEVTHVRETTAEENACALADMLPQQTEVNSVTAALLRQHGITMLPTDNNNTLLSALESGRTVVLSDAGKLLLKESETSRVKKGTLDVKSGAVSVPAPAPAPAPTPATAVTGGFSKLVPTTNSKITRIFSINGNQLIASGTTMPQVTPVRRVKPLITSNVVPISQTKLLTHINKPLTVKVERFKYLGHVLTSDFKDADIERQRRVLSVVGNMVARFGRCSEEGVATGGAVSGARAPRSAVLNLEQLRTLQKEGMLKLRSADNGRDILIHRNNLRITPPNSINTASPTIKLAKVVKSSAGTGVTPAAPILAEASWDVTRLRAELAAARAALAEREREVLSLRRRLLVYEPAAPDLAQH